MLNRTPALSIVFISSAAVLVIEILASRMMAPFVGMSHEIFTSIIGVILAGIALGSFLGGYIADRYNSKYLIGLLFIVAGLSTVLSIPIVASVGTKVAADTLGISLLTFSGFFVPAVALTSIGPMVAKMRLASLENTGEVVGTLSAFGTLGALIATFGTGFVLISYFSVNTIILGVGAILMVIGFYYATREKPMGVVPIVGIALFSVLPIFYNEPCQYKSAYACIHIDENEGGGVKLLVLDRRVHGAVKIDDPIYQHLQYTKVITQVIDAIKKESLNAIHIGGGAFVVPRYISAISSASKNVTYEIDPILVEVGEKEFGLIVDANNVIEVGDARVSLSKEKDNTADLVVGDAFSSKAVPWHLTTSEFISDIKRVLTDDGVYVMNMIDVEGGEFISAELNTLSEHFNNIKLVLPSISRTGTMNQIVVATNYNFDFSVSDDAGLITNPTIDYEYVLTDAFAPVELLTKLK